MVKKGPEILSYEARKAALNLISPEERAKVVREHGEDWNVVDIYAEKAPDPEPEPAKKP